eukprot:1974828-Rhodomonas_salina.1
MAGLERCARLRRAVPWAREEELVVARGHISVSTIGPSKLWQTGSARAAHVSREKRTWEIGGLGSPVLSLPGAIVSQCQRTRFIAQQMSWTNGKRGGWLPDTVDMKDEPGQDEKEGDSRCEPDRQHCHGHLIVELEYSSGRVGAQFVRAKDLAVVA